MLALPQFDTCGVLRQYALHPNDPYVLVGFHMLKERASRTSLWDAFGVCRNPDSLQQLLYLRLGAAREATRQSGTSSIHQGKGKPMSEITDEEAAQMYKAACKQIGIEIDLPASVKTEAGESK